MKSLGYLRVSHLESLNGNSFDTQEKKIRQYAELHDLKVERVYSEVVSGAVEFRKRSAFRKIVDQLKRGDNIIVSRIDRLGRSTLNTLQFVQEMKTKYPNAPVIKLIFDPKTELVVGQEEIQ